MMIARFLKVVRNVAWVYCVSLVVFACSSYGYYSTVDKYRPESYRPSFLSFFKRPPSRTENWDNYKVGASYKIKGKLYKPKEDEKYKEVGYASWYGPKFHNKLTANGEIFDRHDISAAHRTLPMPCMVRVTNLENGKTLLVRVNDRGPFEDGRILDLSERAADLLGFRDKGVAKIKVEFDKVQTAKLFHDNHDVDAPPTPRVQTARHHTSPRETTMEARLHSYDQHFVQTGSYSSRDSASSIAKGLNKVGNVRIEEAELRGSILYRVKVGPYKTQEEAGKALEQVAYLGFDDAIIVGK
jgi:rare lipoprotein A